MKKLIIIILVLIIIVFLLGFIIPRISNKHSDILSRDYEDTITWTAYNQFDSFLEKFLITNIEINGKNDETVYATAYIFGVLKYATLEVNFRREREGKITWKRWSGK